MSEQEKRRQLETLWSIMEETEQLLRGDSIIRPQQVPDFSDLAAGLTGHVAARTVPISEMDLSQIEDAVKHCTRCPLHAQRTLPVPGRGVLNPKVMIIGEAPGAQEDKTGEPFVGRSGKYLDSWMKAIGLTRENDLFIGNIIKCRPPQNRDPSAEEQDACMPYLLRQLELIRPKTILCLGRVASQILLDTTDGIGRLRGQTFKFHSIPVVVTYHPSAVLRYPDKYRRPVWEDLQRLRDLLADVDR